MFKALRQFLGATRHEKVNEIEDGVLGILRLDDDREFWNATLRVGDRSITLTIGGDSVPDSALLTHARDMKTSHKTVQRTGASRFAPRKIERYRQLAPVAYLVVRGYPKPN